MTQRSRRLRDLACSAPLLFLIALASGCDESPGCVFSGNCDDENGGATSGPPATFPDNGQKILPNQKPVVDSVYPTGTVASSTPVLVVFSEAMAPDTIEGKIEIDGGPGIPFNAEGAKGNGGGDGGGFGVTSQVLLAGGRVLLIFPGGGVPLAPGDYVIQVADGAEIFDLTGERATLTSLQELGSFTVPEQDPDELTVIGTFPRDGENAVNTATPIVVAFDQPIDPATVDASSFVVSVGGVPLAADPDPEPVLVGPFPDTRVWVYENVVVGEPVSFGTAVEVGLELTEDIATAGSEPISLEPFSMSFTTQAIEPPLSAAILSTPMDGIGISNLTPNEPTCPGAGVCNELLMQVDLDIAQEGDVVHVVMFGDSKTEEPHTFAASTSKNVVGPGLTIFTLDELDIATSPGVARFGDGPVAFAFALQRGSQTTTVRLLDVDLVAAGIQDPVLDTEPPVLVELLSPGGGVLDQFRSDQRGLVLAGTASEEVRRVQVSTPLGDNGSAPAVGSSSDGVFLAAPVAAVGVLPGGGPLDFDVTVYDRVLNASATQSGVFTQLGAVGPATIAVPGDPIAVEVFDALTLAPVAGVRAFTHEDLGDGINFPLVDSAAFDAGGSGSLASAPTAGATILTVEATGYGLFTFHGIEAARISIPLSPAPAPAAAVAGAVGTASLAVGVDLIDLQKKVDDTRRFASALPTLDVAACTGDPLLGIPPVCPFGPAPIRAGRLGAASFFGGAFQQAEATFSAPLLLQAFELQVPRPPVAAAESDAVTFDVKQLYPLSGELAVEPVDTTLVSAFTTGLVPPLVGDPETTGDPLISIEGRIPGLSDGPAVGIGLAFAHVGGVWAVRGAFPKAVWEDGELGPLGSGTVEAVFLTAELRDSAGSVAGHRVAILPPASPTDPPEVPPFLTPAAVAAVTSPLGSVQGPSYSVVFDNSIPDFAGQPGLYLVTLTDATGRTWTLLVPDRPDGQTMSVRLPDLSGGVAAGVPLADGAIQASVAAATWPAFDAASFSFSDIERERVFYSTGGPVAFTQTP